MKEPVQIINPMIISQGFSGAHQAVDIRNYDFQRNTALPHCAIENSEIVETGRGKTYGENYILLKGLESATFWLYCHNTPLVSSGLLQAGDAFAVPDLSGKGNTGYHLHLEHWARMPENGMYFRLNPLDFFSAHNLKWMHRDNG